jgi:MFS family permease
MLATIAGLLLLAQAGVHAGYFPLVLLALSLMGAGMGTGSVPLLTLAMADVPAADAGLASGIVNVSQQVAGAAGVAVLGTVATDHTRSLLAHGHALPAALTAGYHVAFIVGAGWVAVGVLAAVALVRPSRRSARRLEPSAETHG